MRLPVARLSLPVPSALLALACAASPLWAQAESPARGEDSGQEVPRASVESFGNHRGTFSLVRDQKRAHGWSQAKRYLQQDRGAAAVESLLEVLETSPSTVLDKDGDRYVGLRVVARETLAALPAETRAVYQRRIGLEAQPELERALRGADVGSLLALTERFPHSEQSYAAALAAGDLLLERGQLVRALEVFSALPRRDNDSTLWTRLLYLRRLLDLPIAEHRLPQQLEELEWKGERIPRSVWLQRTRELREEPVRAPWPSFGGGLSNARFAPEPGHPWTAGWQQRLSRLQSVEASRSDIFPVSDGRAVFVNTGNALYGLEGYSSRGWVFEGPLHFDDDPYSFLDTVNRHATHSAAIGDELVIAPLQVPVATDAASGNKSFNGIPIMRRLPVRRLYALEKETGRLRWSHWGANGRMPEGLENAAIDVSGPPLIVGDTVFVATHKQLGTIALHLSAFDLHTGELRWSTLVCSSQIEVNMFGNAQIEHIASPLAYDNGVLYGCTNLGVIYALDARDGAVRWLRAYDIIPIPRARMMPRQRRVYWGNNPPIVSDGVVVFTPLDSEEAIAVEQEDAELLWRMNYSIGGSRHSRGFGHSGPQLRWMLGVSQGRVYFSGQCIAAAPLRASTSGQRISPKILTSSASLGQEYGPRTYSIPRGLLTRKWIYFLSANNMLYKLDHDGRVADADRSPRDVREIGNLVSAGGILYSAQANHLTSYFSRRTLLSNAAQRVRENPGDPALVLELAELWAADERKSLIDLGRTTELFERSVRAFRENAIVSDASRRAELGLFRAQVELARKRFEVDENRALPDYRAAIATGVDLQRRHSDERGLERDLLRLISEAVVRFAAREEFREELLTRLETEHADTRYLFAGKGRMPASLYASLIRLDYLEDKRRNAEQRLALLQRILRDHSDETIDTTSARSFAVTRIRDLLQSYGEELYAPFEREAEALLKSAGGRQRAPSLDPRSLPPERSGSRRSASSRRECGNER
jgi:outer membrane protein assembly factor BamB